jgi:hypothetical protein
LPWVLVRTIHRFPTDLAQGSFASRVLSRVGSIGSTGELLLRYLHSPRLWTAILVALLVVPHAYRLRERFVLLVFVFQIAIYVVTYLGTPYTVEWQVATSWPRLTSQVATPLLVAVMLMLARTFAPEDDLPHAEARSEP